MCENASLLGEYFVAIREKRNYTVQRMSLRTGFPVEIYSEFEKLPENVPCCELIKMMRALKMTAEEFGEFNVLARKMFKIEESVYNKEKLLEIAERIDKEREYAKSKTAENVILLKKIGINQHRTKSKSLKSNKSDSND